MINLYGKISLSLILVLLLTFFGFLDVSAQTDDDCFACHDDNELTGEMNGREVSVYINPKVYGKSIHADIECISCHMDLDGFEDFPHEDELAIVNCGECHDDISSIYMKSLHGSDVQKGDKFAPRCWDCHGKHDIMESSSPESRVAKFNIPFMCGKCHKEGTEVTQTYEIHQDSILAHYSLSIHGVGLFQQGLTVTAVCNDCHTSHNVLPHTDSKSSIHRDNVAETCQKCHGRIKEVHKKVVRGELWEKEPDKVPVCVDCHEPHEVRKVFYAEGISDSECLKCHSNKNLTAVRQDGEISMYVDSVEVHSSMHRSVSCAQCHTGANTHLKRPCSTIGNKVDCSICHQEKVLDYSSGVHGMLADRGDLNAPTCGDCHGKHGILGKRDPDSPSYPTNVPTLCASCHREGNPAAARYEGEQHNILENYVMSIHGKGLLESGLIVTAMCTDCHTAHHVLRSDDSLSSVYKDNIPKTCAKCHRGIFEQFAKSVHCLDSSTTDEPLPNCDDCHKAHEVKRTDQLGFREDIMDQCGRCHEDVTETYFETVHGKASKLGYDAAAKCYDCHGAHDILPIDNPNSTLSHQNIVGTCGECHEGSHRQFAGYLTHATHHDRDKYPILFYTFWFMTILLTSTLIVFGTHTLMWLPRSFQMMKEKKKVREKTLGNKEFQRFKPYQRRLHFLVIISFLGLALTGMTLKFSYLAWAQWISHVLGGFGTAAYIHRVCAVITFFYFFTHIFFLIKEKRDERISWKKMIFGPDSMLPNKTDLKEIIATFKWFIGRGPRPAYGRWTYWEKFDYFAVFWGVAIIGTTGLILWFPEFFTLFLPGWFINIATIVHSDEALLAVAFIFTVHFFNTHFRPDKFPMDTVIFTGRMSVEELKEERPREYEQLIKDNKLVENMVQPIPPPIVRGMRIFGAIALIIGIGLILLIIYAEIFGYK